MRLRFLSSLCLFRRLVFNPRKCGEVRDSAAMSQCAYGFFAANLEEYLQMWSGCRSLPDKFHEFGVMGGLELQLILQGMCD